MKKAEYSQIVRRKLKNLRARLTSEFGAEVSRKSIRQITDAARGLEDFEEKGISVSSMYGIECDYRYIYAGRNYLFYRIESDKIIIAEMFDEREDGERNAIMRKGQNSGPSSLLWVMSPSTVHIIAGVRTKAITICLKK